MIAVCRKELRSYRISMIGYVFVAFMLAVVSLYFAYQNLNLASPRFELVLQNVQFIFLVFVPILTMRVLAEEKKQKTDQLLLTLPMTVKDIVIGKYLAVVVLFTIPMLIICIYPLILTMFGSVNLPAAYFSILGFYLLGCANIAIGVFFSSCIDIHNGKVKQIVGGSLKDAGDQAKENFVSGQDATFYAELYKKAGLKGGHVILLNGKDSEYYEATRNQALKALRAYPGGLQIGGGVCPENAQDYLNAGASHVIVTSYVFKDGRLSWENLARMEQAAGREHLVLDLSCRKKDNQYFIVTDRWQKFTDVPVTLEVMEELGSHCDEFLVHAVDVEGKANGIETELADLLSAYQKRPITYAGGVGSMQDIKLLKLHGKGRLDVTVGSALDLFGGTIPFETLKNL